MDFILGKEKHGLSPHSIAVGIKVDAGYEYWLNDQIKLGLIYSFNRSLSPFGKYIDTHNAYNQSSLLSVAIGYRL